MKWVFKRLAQIDSPYKNKKGDDSKNSYSAECIRLKYCLECKDVWEVTYNGIDLHHKSLPTYGIKRQICRRCNDKKEKK